MQTRRWAAALVVLTLVGVQACFNMTYVTNRTPAASSDSTWNHFFLWGIAGTSDVDLTDECPNGVARVEVKHSVATILVSMLLVGLYNPTTTEYWCAVDASASGAEPRPPILMRGRR